MLDIRALARDDTDKLTLKQDADTVADGEDFSKFGRDIEYCYALFAQPQHTLHYVLHGTDVQTQGRVDNEEKVGVSRDFACQHHALLISARQLAHSRPYAWSSDVVCLT